MTISPGSRLGPYEVLSPLGAGGMGEVYRAKDTRLGREVAVKVLPEEFARDAERLARFEREARLLASLSHPNVGAIYGLEESEGVRFLALELVEGETLDERLAAGPLRLAEALPLARQIAEALEAAHEKAIVHRDLKPGNVKVTPEGRVKVLDFGLAKALVSEADTDASHSPTLTQTQAGSVLGTPAYMSPEQARGRAVDKRADIWSFGCVLYEMLTGRKAFAGDTVSDTMAAILTREPDWSALPSTTPESVRHLLQRCLEKDRERRLRDAGDVRLEIDEALAKSVGSARGGQRLRLSGAAVLAVAAVVVAVAVLPLLQRRDKAARAASPQRLSQITFAEGIEEAPSWSPDGRQLAYSAEAGAVRKIFIKQLDTAEERRLTSGEFDDIEPSWSPDGQTVLFVRSREPGRKLEPGDVFGQYDDGDVWAIDVASGKETRLIEAAFNPSCSPEGTRIAFDASWVGPRRIWITDAQGHNPQQATSDISEASAHVRPRWSPDGTKIVFQNIERTKFDIRVADVASKGLIWVTNDVALDVDPVWSPTGRFIYFSSARSGGINLWRVAVSSDGSPSGSLQQLTSGAGQDVEAAISADGKKLAFSILKQNADIWELPVSPQTGQPTGAPQEVIATTREDSRGAWSPDGQTIAFNSDRSGEMNIWLFSRKDRSSRQLTRGPGGDFQPNWSPDGRRLAFFSSRSGIANIWSVDVGSGQLQQLTRGRAIDVNPFFSPDGGRIAYQSDQSGRLEVWIMRANGSEARQLTRVGVTGHFLRWMPDGRSILFRCPSGGKPQSLLVSAEAGEPAAVAEVAGGSHMSFSPDGSRIMDVLSHKTLWVSPLATGKPEKVFAFDDADSRIDYPVWSPDGHYVLFDRFRPQGGDIWVMENAE